MALTPTKETTMRTTTFALATLATLAAAPSAPGVAGAAAQEPVRVVATLPVYGAIARALGGDEVEVSSIAEPNEDAHFVRPKPSFALDLRRADLFITTGLDLELWVPTLLDKAGNPDVLEGGRGYVTAYTGVTLLDAPATADRSQGDIHIFGNPHLHTDPLRALQVARNIAAGLERVAPDRAAVFQQGLQAFTRETYRRLFGERLVGMLGGEALEQLALSGNLFPFLEQREFQGQPLRAYLGGWLDEASPFRGRQMICYHKDWAYFEERFGLTCADYVESKPGIPPTPRHVVRLIALMREEEIPIVIAPNYYDASQVEQVAERGGAVALVVPFYPNPAAGIPTYFDLVDRWIEEVGEAYEDAGDSGDGRE